MSETTVNVSISRSNQGDISIRIGDEASRLQIVEVSMTPEMFGDCVTGLSFCKGNLRQVIDGENVQYIGSERRIKHVGCDHVKTFNKEDQRKAVHDHFNEKFGNTHWKLHSDGMSTKQPGDFHRYSIYCYEGENQPVSTEINPEDLSLSTFNTNIGGFSTPNNAGFRLVHKPTGIKISCSSERSQHKNKAKALEELKLRLSELASQS